MFGVHKSQPVPFSRSRVLAIDPGNEHSAWVKLDCESNKILEFGYEENETLHSKMRCDVGLWLENIDHLAIEMIASYGARVGKTVFDTCVWIGRFIEVANRPFTQVYRKDVKMHLTDTNRSTDADVREVLIEKFGKPGKKSAQGPTYGISGDVWQALGVACTYAETIYKR